MMLHNPARGGGGGLEAWPQTSCASLSKLLVQWTSTISKQQCTLFKWGQKQALKAYFIVAYSTLIWLGILKMCIFTSKLLAVDLQIILHTGGLLYCNLSLSLSLSLPAWKRCHLSSCVEAKQATNGCFFFFQGLLPLIVVNALVEVRGQMGFAQKKVAFFASPLFFGGGRGCLHFAAVALTQEWKSSWLIYAFSPAPKKGGARGSSRRTPGKQKQPLFFSSRASLEVSPSFRGLRTLRVLLLALLLCALQGNLYFDHWTPHRKK